jgi:putative photosynthetic complex assembly protein
MVNAAEPAIIPRWFIAGAALVILGAFLSIAILRLSGASAQQLADAPAVAERSLRFVDTTSGNIEVIDATENTVIFTVTPGAHNFLRGAVRALARERKPLGIGAERAFNLVRRSDGRLTLIDPATTHRVDLESFGPSNAAIFVDLLAIKNTGDPIDVSATTSSTLR